MATYIILIFLFIVFVVILQVVNFGLLIFIVLLLKGIIKYKEKPATNFEEKENRGFGFGK